MNSYTGKGRTAALLLSTLLLGILLLLSSCNTSLSVRVTKQNTAELSLSLQYSKQAAELFKGITEALDSSSEQTQIISAQDIKAFLTAAGLQNVTAQTNKPYSIEAGGTITDFSSSQFINSGMLTVQNRSVKFTFGPEQLKALYDSMDSEAAAYLDLLMIPCLNDETMTLSEYKELLSSVYGPELAAEITDAKISINLSAQQASESSSGKAVTLGELFTLTSSKNWILNW